ncbi:UNVERIFIED_CONTAM: hypothetical protein FKN15_007394 [Acipenser sinensis]
MWIERTSYLTAYKFPGILKWFEVKSVSIEEISPLENAIETMELTNEKLSNLVQHQACDRSLPVHPLSMLLSGIVDPAVMGGFSNYEKAFFTERYLQDHPGDQERIELLKQLIAIQIPLLADGIQIHGEKSTEQLKPLHNRLVTCFQELKEKVEKHYGVITLPSSLTERKKSRTGSIVMPYILSSTLRRLSTISVASSGVSSCSTSSESSSRPCSNDSLLAPVSERRGSVLSRAEEPFCDNRISRFNRKEWNISKSQVLTEREPDVATPPERPQRPKSLQFGDRRMTLSLFQGPSSQQNLSTPLSPPPGTPCTPRSSSFSSLQSEGDMNSDLQDTPPPMPPKHKPLENGSQRNRNSTEIGPPLPVKGDSKPPPPPPPKTRRSVVPSPDHAPQ